LLLHLQKGNLILILTPPYISSIYFIACPTLNSLFHNEIQLQYKQKKTSCQTLFSDPTSN